MNQKDMECRKEGKVWERYLIVEYKSGPIAQAQLKNAGKELSFFFRDGRVITHDITKHVIPETAYLDQFGISVSEDCTLFFIQHWRKGLFCFHMQTGQLKWHHKLKRAYNLIVLRNVVVCYFCELCVMTLDIDSGEARNRIPLGFDTKFKPINDTRYLIGPKRGKYLIIDEELNTVASIPYETFNPNGHRTFIIVEANPAEGGIEISGFEYTDAERGSAEKYRFSRIIPCDLQMNR